MMWNAPKDHDRSAGLHRRSRARRVAVARGVASLVCSLFLLLVFASPAAAYIDMGTTSYVFNVIVGAIFSGLFLVKIYWNKLTDFARRVVLRREPEAEASQAETAESDPQPRA